MDMDGKLPSSQPGPPVNPGPAVKKKQPRKNQRRKSNSANKNENTSFKWWHPVKSKSVKWWHKALMDFMVKYPEHLAKLERQLRELANVLIEVDHLVVKAKSSQVDSTWRNECEEKLLTFFRDHTAQNIHVRNFHPAMLNDSKTHVAQLWPSNGCIVVAVAGLAKDVAQKIHTLKQQDKPRPYQQTSPSKIVVDNMSIQKFHCQRLSDAIMERIAANCQVSMVWILPCQLQICGIQNAVGKARQMVTDEIFRTKVKKIFCQEWLFDQLLQERNEALRYFPELQIWSENGEMTIMGHPSEVNTVYDKLHREMDAHNELKMTVSKKYHGYIIGTKGQKIVELQKNHQVFIIVPNRASDDNVVQVRGKKASTESAKIEIEALIAGVIESSKRSAVHLQISESHRHRLNDDILRAFYFMTFVCHIHPWKYRLSQLAATSFGSSTKNIWR